MSSIKLNDILQFDNLDNMNIKKINLGEFIQGWFVDYDERFLPYSKDIKEKYKHIVYETDKWGFLPEYKIIFMLSNRNQKNEKYVFLGNYKLDDINKPKIEFDQFDYINLNRINDKFFELQICYNYYHLNMRQESVYSKPKKLRQ